MQVQSPTIRLEWSVVHQMAADEQDAINQQKKDDKAAQADQNRS